MWHNFLTVGVRRFVNNKLVSFINLFGLALGLASAILIGLYVDSELNYDRHHPAADRIYRIGRDLYPRENFEGLYLATVPVVAADQLKQDYPQFELVARASPGTGLVGREDRMFYENALLYADPELLDLFDFQWLVGDPATALVQPNSIVLTETLARKYFGTDPAMGQTLIYENRSEMYVTGVIADLPQNTHLEADALRPMAALLNALPESLRQDWGPNLMHTYVRIARGTDIKAVESTFPAFVDRHIPPAFGRSQASQFTGITATRVSDIHLTSTRQNEMREPGSMATVLALAAVACCIVLIACFNFMNLSTARSLLRGKEVGIRKAIGAERKQLVMQFLGESFGMAMIAMLIAIMLVEVSLPGFNVFSGKTLTFDVLSEPRLQAALCLLFVVIGIGAGSYPALYLSAFKSTQVLKGRISFGLRDHALRNLLVVLQFAISITLVVVTIVISLQIRYVRDFDPGFDKEQVVILGGSPTAGLTERWPALREELLRHPGIVSVTASNLVPGMENLIDIPVRARGAAASEARTFSTLIVDYGFFETFKVKLLAGREFSTDFAGDMMPAVTSREMTANFMLNESAARVLGWTPEQAVGQPLQTGIEGTNSNIIRGQVVGVVSDANFESLRFDVPPLIFLLGQQGQGTGPVFSTASVRITGTTTSATLEYIDAAWKRVIPDFPVIRRFLSEDFEALYRDDARLGQLFSSFAGLAIVIACLGLFGLATFNAQRRIKEIGIRKVMGGSVWSIVLLLTNDFSKLVLLSNLIAWPVAYFAMERWLENFAYRIDLTPLVFIGSGLIALCIAWVTVGGTAAKAASAKPVLALRYE